MQIRLLFAWILILLLSCNRDKQSEAGVSANQPVVAIADTVAQQKTIDSLLFVYNNLFHAVPFVTEEMRRDAALLFTMAHSTPTNGLEFNDLQTRINELKYHINIEREGNAYFKTVIDTITNLARAAGGQAIEFYQFKEWHQDYYQEITVINYSDSAKAILRIFSCDTLSNCTFVRREEKKISLNQWNTLEQKSYSSHFWGMELTEIFMMGEGSALNIRAGRINSQGIADSYHEVIISMSDGSLENMNTYAGHLFDEKSRFHEFEVPHHHHHGC